MSDSFDISEFEALQLWISISSPDNRRWFEVETGSQLNSSLPAAARQWYMAHKECAIQAVMQLMKSRMDEDIASDMRAVIMTSTNRLLRDGVAAHLLNALRSAITEMQSCAGHRLKIFLETSVKQLAECLFFCFYQTQIIQSELQLLQDLILLVSDTIASANSPSGAWAAVWHDTLIFMLQILQLTYVCALNQTSHLYSRDADVAPFTANDIGNAIVPNVEARIALEQQAWKCSMAKGFVCLVQAVLRQPYVDVDEAPPGEVTSLLVEAMQLRALTYIRITMLPVLQAITSNDNQIFYVSVISELLTNLLTMICLPVYADVGMPFPVSRSLHEQDVQWSNQQLGTGDADNVLPTTMVDCQDDFLSLLTAALELHPPFAAKFWQSGTHHPYIAHALGSIAHDSTLLAAVMRFLGAIASSTVDVSVCEAVYALLKHRHFSQYDWAFFFHILESYATQLSADGEPGRERATLSPADTEALTAICYLLEGVCRSCRVTENILSSGYGPVEKFFALLSCSVPPVLKGALFRCLASLCSCADNDAAYDGVAKGLMEEIWTAMDNYKLLPTGGRSTSMPFGNKETAGSKQFFGLQYELEAIESTSGIYSVTDGFLSLMVALVQNGGVPGQLGHGQRVPGIVCYLEHVIEDILYKMHMRVYFPAGPLGESQRWRIVTKALSLLYSVVQGYEVNRLTVADVANAKERGAKRSDGIYEDDILSMLALDFVSVASTSSAPASASLALSTVAKPPVAQQFPHQKSAGFSVMSCLLSHGRKLLDYLLSLVRDNSPDALHNSRIEQINGMCRIAAEFIGAVDATAKDISVEALAAATLERHISDGTFWRHKAVGSALGLIYECSIRESVYMTLLREGANISELRAVLASGNALYSSRVTELATSLSTSSLSIDNPLAIIATHAAPAAESIYCDPSVPVLALMIIEHVASKQSSRRLLSLIGEADGGLTNSCVAALCSAVPTTVYGYGTAAGVRKAPVVLPLGSRVVDIEDVFTAATSVQLNEGEESSSRQIQLREAVLQLLLTTLMPDRVCLTHQLLGLRDAVENNGSSGERYPMPEPGAPRNCLDAVLDLLDPETAVQVSPSDSLVAVDPIAADMCLELLYRLAASPLTTRTVLSVLRRRCGGNFYRNLLSILLVTPMSMKSVAIQIETAATNCCAWFLKLVALELRFLELSQDVHLGRLTQMLQLFFQSEDNSLSEVPLIALLGSMQLDVSLDINVESPLVVQCLTSCATPCSISRGRPYDARSELAQSFSVVDVAAFVELMNASAPGATREADGPKRSRESDAEGAEDIAIEFNVHNMRMACAAHVCQGWRQVLDIASVACGQLLLMLCSQCHIETSSHALIELQSGGKLPVTPLGVSTIAHSILIPVLKILISYPGMHMVLAEQISRTVLSLVSLLRGCIVDGDFTLAPELHRSVVSGLVGAILRRGTASQARTSSSATYRGFLYSALINVLRASHTQSAGIGLDDTVVDLMDVLGKDASIGPVTWRTCAISCLNTVLCYSGRLFQAQDVRVGASRVSAFSTPSRFTTTAAAGGKSATFHHMILSLKSQGHLQKSLGSVGLTAASAPMAEDESSSAMMESLLCFCATLCSVSEGVQMLIDFGTFDCINQLPVISPLALERRDESEFSIFHTKGTQDTNAVEEALVMMENLCRLYFAAASSHSSKRTVSYCLAFLHRHSQVVSHFLHFRVASLRGLRIADMLVNLMCCIVSSSSSLKFSSTDSPAGANDAHGSWDAQLGAKGDVFTMDMCALMRAIGMSPIPRYDASTALTSQAYTSPKLWWQVVQPASSHEAMLKESIRESPRIISDIEAWTGFDEQLMKGGLLLLEHLASFLRIRASQWVAMRQIPIESLHATSPQLDTVGLLSVDRESVTSTFCNVASLYLQLSTLHSGDESSQIDEVHTCLLRAAESLISAIHDMSLAMSEAERSNWARHCREVADICEKFPVQSFVRQTSLWIKG